jgi:hypothetical protein
MISVTTALTGLAMYFLALFVLGLLWRGREVSQKLRKEKTLREQQFASRSGEYAHLA